MPTLLICCAPVRFTPIIISGLTAGLLALSACASSHSASGTGGTTGSSAGTGGKSASTSGATVGSGGAVGAGGGVTTCPPAMTYGGGEAKVTGRTVTATIVDETGAAVVGQPVYICGLDICSDPTVTQAGGMVSISTPLTMKKPAFKFGDALSYAELAIPLTAGTTDFNMLGSGKLATGKLAGKPGAALTPGADAVSGDVTISLPAGASVGIDQIVYYTPDSEKFRSVSIPLANVGPVFAPVTLSDGGAPDFQLLYGVAPSETTLCPAAKVTVALPHTTMTPNDLGWAAGASVEFWIMTIDTGQTYAPYAGWAKMSDGVVSADGTSVATVDGQGFILLETFAIRLAM